MELLEQLINDFKTLDVSHQTEVIDFVKLVKEKQEAEFLSIVEDIFEEYDESLKELAK